MRFWKAASLVCLLAYSGYCAARAIPIQKAALDSDIDLDIHVSQAPLSGFLYALAGVGGFQFVAGDEVTRRRADMDYSAEPANKIFEKLVRSQELEIRHVSPTLAIVGPACRLNQEFEIPADLPYDKYSFSVRFRAVTARYFFEKVYGEWFDRQFDLSSVDESTSITILADDRTPVKIHLAAAIFASGWRVDRTANKVIHIAENGSAGKCGASIRKLDREVEVFDGNSPEKHRQCRDANGELRKCDGLDHYPSDSARPIGYVSPDGDKTLFAVIELPNGEVEFAGEGSDFNDGAVIREITKSGITLDFIEKGNEYVPHRTKKIDYIKR